METKKKLEKIAFVTYNRIGSGEYENGVIESGGKQLFLAQNGHLSKWAAVGTDSEKKQIRERASTRALSQINLTDMDKVYLYVGSHGSEDSILKTRFMSAKKVSYVLCDCNLSRKKELIRDVGNVDSEIIMCECGGRETMERLLKSYLN